MEEKLHEFETDAITVTWSKRRCIHSAACIMGLPDVFEPGRRPWVMPQNDSPDEVASVVRRCPTGALQYRRHDGGPAETPPNANRVLVGRSGPLYLRGNVEIRGADGALRMRDTRLALCRCGASRNQPFCDNAHLESGFRDPGTMDAEAGPPASPGAAPGASAAGPLSVTLTPDGPLAAEGELIVMGADGRARRVSGLVKFCRCGASATKPFCDGSHTRVGFAAP